MHITPKNSDKLFQTDILFQSPYWAKVKTILGWKPYAFDIDDTDRADILVLTKHIDRYSSACYVPHGPEFAPDKSEYGAFLEELSEAIVQKLNPGVAFIRYDLPWESHYADEMRIKHWSDFPESRIRELRMNFGTKHWNLRKAPVDMTVTNSYIVHILSDEDEMLARMKPKTRYNIRLSKRKGVHVRTASIDELPEFYRIYCITAERNGFAVGGHRQLAALFDEHSQGAQDTDTQLLFACHKADILAGAIIAISGKRAFFLHGASSNEKREFMGNYALHWEAIRYASLRGYGTYEMGAVSPGRDPSHSFYGLYRFKSGFGGDIVHRSGSWDYPIDEDTYVSFRNGETLQESRCH